MGEQEEVYALLFGQQRIKKEVLEQTKKRKNVIYGARSVNRQISGFLNKPTKDYDIYSTMPKKDAKNLEHRLDKRFHHNLFMTRPAQHPGTTKVVTIKTHVGIADYTQKPKGLKTKTLGGVMYSRLSHEQKNRLKSLSEKESAFRHKKDKESLDRIRIQRRLARLG